jgi:hypothetical protein
MPDLGTKYECYSCGAKFYDMGRPEPTCPKCGANQKDAKRQELASESLHAKRKKREEVVARPPEEEEVLIGGPADEDFPEEEIEAPEGVETEEVVEDIDDDEE